MPRVTLENVDLTSVYKLSDIDSAGTTKYFGYVEDNGNWYIMRLTDTEARYVKGSSDYTTAWTGKAALEYDYFFNVF